MTPDPFRAALDELIRAGERLHLDRSPEAFLAWHQAVDDVKRLHEDVEARSVARARRGT